MIRAWDIDIKAIFMDFLQIWVLALVQGITEFLPVSSSAHLILTAHLLGLGKGFLAFDIAVHGGTLAAVIFHFRRELVNISSAQPVSSKSTLSFNQNIWPPLVVASLPVIIAGALLEGLISNELRSTWVIATTTIIFAFALWYADSNRRTNIVRTISLKYAFIIGLAQVLALIPGTSRAGITITAALLLGLSRRQSLNFSFLLAIPVIGGAVVFNAWNMLQDPEAQVALWYPIILGFIISALFALLTIKLFIHFVEKIGLLPFVIYRLLLGVVLFLLITN